MGAFSYTGAITAIGNAELRELRGGPVSSRGTGRSTQDVECPFCGTWVETYVWSRCGGGKKCPSCGALHGRATSCRVMRGPLARPFPGGRGG